MTADAGAVDWEDLFFWKLSTEAVMLTCHVRR
jgi:hypothetical protein